MAHIPTTTLRRYLLQGHLSARGCRQLAHRGLRPALTTAATTLISRPTRALHADSQPVPPPAAPVHVPLRKQLKDEAKKAKAAGKKKTKNANNQVVPGWELTVGIEIHAQLNTERKLFSPAYTPGPDDDAPPNSHVAFFDLATPGSQPVFQPPTLIPALRAALALGCTVQPVSRFDRKHYFHWDQPSGYQITQYYEPFAREGRILLQPRDGIATEDGDGIAVRIQQVQMEQDTAKTMAQPGDTHWIDFNRTGVPLIEIITRPDMHHPATAAALVRKVQALLGAVDACVSGLEAGGLRADVNVSVRRSGDPDVPLGTRTEIKNLSSFKAIEDAIIAERDRQIAVLEAGGVVQGETRGWSIGATETRRLRGKEGEVDYRYMPDPDLPPVVIGEDLVEHLRNSMGQLPDAAIDELVDVFGLTAKDALSLAALDGGARVEYFWRIVDALQVKLGLSSTSTAQAGEHQACFQLAANWILHELGRLTSNPHGDAAQDLGFKSDGQCTRVPVAHLTDILLLLHQRRITAKVAKELLWVVYRGDIPGTYASVEDAVTTEGMWFAELSDAEYAALADEAAVGQDAVVRQFMPGASKQYPQGKLMFLVGRMLKLGQEERIDPLKAERVMRRALEERHVPNLLKQQED